MYTIAHSIEEVNKLMQDGWVSQWWVCEYVCNNSVYIAQAMVKYPKKSRKVSARDKSIDPELQKFVEAWNSVDNINGNKWFPKTRVITNSMQREWDKIVKEFKDIKLIGNSIWKYEQDIYHRVKRDGSDYHLHRFTFEQFIKQANWARKFINS